MARFLDWLQAEWQWFRRTHLDRRQIRHARFRTRRAYLADHVFLDVPGGDTAPNDLVDRDSWESAMALPTDVLLRTTDYQGTMFVDAHEQWAAWIHATPSTPEECPFLFDVALDAADEFHAAPFIAAHGWYRQATAALRNALEGVAIGAALGARSEETRYRQWRQGAYEPKFGNMVDLLRSDATVGALDRALAGGGLFGANPDGVARELYRRLSRYAHGAPGHTNVDIWNSNGPVWVWAGFRDFWVDLSDTMALCYVLGKIAWPDLTVPDDARPLFAAVSDVWQGLGEMAYEAYFTHAM